MVTYGLKGLRGNGRRKRVEFSVFELPRDSTILAVRYSKLGGCRVLEPLLAKFLCDVGTSPSLLALGLGIVRQGGRAFISIHAFTSIESFDSAKDDQLAESYRELEQSLRIVNSPILPEIRFSEIARDGLSKAIKAVSNADNAREDFSIAMICRID